MNQSSHTDSFDSRLGALVRSITLVDKEYAPNYPNASWEHSQGYSEGLYTVSYKTQLGQTNLPKISSQVETQPLLTHGVFRAGGSHELSDGDCEKIAEATSDATLWKKYVAADPTSPLGWYAQFALWGTDSWLAPVVTAKQTALATSKPDFGNLAKTYSSLPGGYSPGLPDRCNWLLAGMESEQIGPYLWFVTSDYRASSGGPWDPDFYSSH
jgi:hypothetical protein